MAPARRCVWRRTSAIGAVCGPKHLEIVATQTPRRWRWPRRTHARCGPYSRWLKRTARLPPDRRGRGKKYLPKVARVVCEMMANRSDGVFQTCQGCKAAEADVVK